MLCIASSVRLKEFQSRLKIRPLCRRSPADFHRPNLFRYCSSPKCSLDLLLFAFGGSLPDGRSIVAFSSTFSFFAHRHFLRAMRVDWCEHHACVLGLRE